MANSPHDDYFGRPDKDSYQLVRVKRDWLPDWAWWLCAHVDRHGVWLCNWLSVEADHIGA